MTLRYHYGNDSDSDTRPTLLDERQKPRTDLLSSFLCPEDPPAQRRLFRYLRLSDTHARTAFLKAAVGLITSREEGLAAKQRVLRSLVGFAQFCEEGVLYFAPASMTGKDAAYWSALDHLAAYLEGEVRPLEEYACIIDCLGRMGYFYVKRTMLLGFAETFIPSDPEWLAKRLRLCVACLDNGDDVAAWHILTFLQECHDTLDRMLSTNHDGVTSLKNVIAALNAIVPSWLLSDDYRVVLFACRYCGRRGLAHALPLLEQLRGSESERVREVVASAIEQLAGASL